MALASISVWGWSAVKFQVTALTNLGQVTMAYNSTPHQHPQHSSNICLQVGHECSQLQGGTWQAASSAQTTFQIAGVNFQQASMGVITCQLHSLHQALRLVLRHKFTPNSMLQGPLSKQYHENHLHKST